MWGRVPATYGIKGQNQGTKDSSVLNFFQRTSFTQNWLRQVMLSVTLGLQNIQPKLNQALFQKEKQTSEKRLATFHFMSRSC